MPSTVCCHSVNMTHRARAHNLQTAKWHDPSHSEFLLLLAPDARLSKLMNATHCSAFRMHTRSHAYTYKCDSSLICSKGSDKNEENAFSESLQACYHPPISFWTPFFSIRRHWNASSFTSISVFIARQWTWCHRSDQRRCQLRVKCHLPAKLTTATRTAVQTNPSERYTASEY